MYKSYIIFFFLILSFLWSNVSLQAVGGSEAEEVPGEEIRRRGILKIQYTDGSTAGTAVLFREGRGWLGLGVKHVFQKSPIVACLGEQKRDVLKAYTPIENIDIVLFVLNAPFEDIEEFPTLTTPLPDTSVYDGYVYGYGYTTSSSHPGSRGVPGAICRKGKQFIRPLFQMKQDTHLAMNARAKERYEDLISFSTFHAKGVSDKILRSSDEYYELNKIILDEGYVPLDGDGSSDRLIASPCFTLAGDSGGPVINNDNELYALSAAAYSNFAMDMRYSHLINSSLQQESYKEHFKLNLVTKELSLGFIEAIGTSLCVSLTNSHSFPLEALGFLRSNVIRSFAEDLTSYYLTGKSEFLHMMVKMEEATLVPAPNITQWVKKIHLYSISYFISIDKYKNWIEKAMPAAFQYIEEHLEITTEEK